VWGIFVTDINLQAYYQQFKTKYASDIAVIHRGMDSAISPFPNKNTNVNLTLYHGTNSKSAKSIVEGGFKLVEKRKNSGIGIGEFGDALYLTPSENVANHFGRNVVKARVKIQNPVKICPQKWGEEVSAKFIREIYPNVLDGLESFRPSELKGKFSYVCNQIISDYMKQRQIDGVFCHDFVDNATRKAGFLKQKQWAIFNPQNVEVLSSSKKSIIPNLKLKFNFNVSIIKQILTKMK